MANRVVMPSIAILALIAALMLMREESVILEKGGSFWHAPRAATWPGCAPACLLYTSPSPRDS